MVHDKHKEYEFGGPVGAFATIVALPILVLGLPIVCNSVACPPLTVDGVLAAVPPFESFVNPVAFAVTFVWFAILVLIYVLFPGNVVEGTVVKALGTKLKYNCNGAGVPGVSGGCLSVSR